MVAGESPEWLPPGFDMKFKYKDGKKVKYFLNVATGKKYKSKKEVILCAEEHNSLPVTPQTKNADENGPSSIDKVDAMSDKTNNFAAWLPNGWKMEERIRQSGSTVGSIYKVYTELSTGSRFYSKPEVTRYLKSIAYDDTMTKKNNTDNVIEPLPDKSPPQVVPVTNTGKIRGKRRNGNPLVMTDNANEPLPDKSPPQVAPVTKTGSIRGKRRNDPRVMIDNVDETVQEKSPQIISTENTDRANRQKEIRGNSVAKIKNVSEPLQDTSPQVISTSTTNTNSIPKNKKKTSSFVMVAVEWTTADDLPSGWIKEIRTSKCGRRIRKDPYYTDPVSGYMFRSKPDAFRYLKTNDIRSCFCKPLKREDEMESAELKTPPSNPVNQKSSMRTRKHSLREESNGGESFGTKSAPESVTKTSKREQVTEEKVSWENSNNSTIVRNNTEAESHVSKEDVRVIAADVAISSPVADPSARNTVGSRKSKKRRESSAPSRSSKRLAGSEPEMKSNFDLNERSLRAVARGSTAREVGASPSSTFVATDIPQTSNIESTKEAVSDAVIRDETRVDINEPKVGDETRVDINEPKVAEEPPTEGSAIPNEQSGAEPLYNGVQSQASQLCYDFGESWSDPLEFALKTLRGELPIEDTFMFPGCFNPTFGQSDESLNLKQSQFDASINLQNEFGSHSESSKKPNSIDQLPATSPSFSPLGNLSFKPFSGFNFQPNTEVGKKDSQTKFNP